MLTAPKTEELRLADEEDKNSGALIEIRLLELLLQTYGLWVVACSL